MSEQLITVLFLEDSPLAVEMVKQALAEATTCRFRVEHASALAMALAYLDHRTADVVLTDLTLPDSEGLDTVTRLYARAPHLPIVVLTGNYEDEQLALQALRTGAQDYVFKEGMVGTWLVRVLRYAIERHRLEETLKEKLRDMQKLDRAMVGREELILELKQEVNELLKGANKPLKYRIS